MTRLRPGGMSRELLPNTEPELSASDASVTLSAPGAAPERAIRRHHLLPIVESMIIPRLMASQSLRPRPAPARPDGAGAIAGECIQELAGLVLDPDSRRPYTYIDGMRACGVPMETIYLDLLGPTANYLGELWDEDICDFTQVTTGLVVLQNMLRSYSVSFQGDARLPCGRRILLSAFPGEQHTFGLSMVAEFFLRAGWQVWSQPAASKRELIRLVHADWFAVVGLSLARETRLDELGALIRNLRRRSLNRGLSVMVGGPVFVEHPDYVARIGADATAIDGRAATMQAETALKSSGATT